MSRNNPSLFFDWSGVIRDKRRTFRMAPSFFFIQLEVLGQTRSVTISFLGFSWFRLVDPGQTKKVTVSLLAFSWFRMVVPGRNTKVSVSVLVFSWFTLLVPCQTRKVSISLLVWSAFGNCRVNVRNIPYYSSSALCRVILRETRRRFALLLISSRFSVVEALVSLISPMLRLNGAAPRFSSFRIFFACVVLVAHSFVELLSGRAILRM